MKQHMTYYLRPIVFTSEYSFHNLQLPRQTPIHKAMGDLDVITNYVSSLLHLTVDLDHVSTVKEIMCLNKNGSLCLRHQTSPVCHSDAELLKSS
ncbi:hypothetical protein OUZ56_030358 [Daphnia magna]|uniref:Uncharacterized protein n=1 Tax=Daphnia magna TaxID=35525 RepID=A0ABQ9ZR29_9CRUS|nr:hypothetical protein OUZ56_030358 [Daphnia magna]